MRWGLAVGPVELICLLAHVGFRYATTYKQQALAAPSGQRLILEEEQAALDEVSIIRV